MLNPAEINQVLCVAAHPDDLHHGAAGAVAGLPGCGMAVSG